MNTTSTLSNSPNQNGTGHLAERAAESVGSSAQNTAARSTKIANDTFDHLSNAVESARNATVPALERLGSGAESLARRSAETARQTSQQLREQAQLRSEQAVGYIRGEPLKSVLFAAALGALFGLLLSFSRRER